MIEKLTEFPQNIARVRSHYVELINSVQTMEEGEMIKFESEGEKKLNRNTILNMIEGRTGKSFIVKTSGKIAYIKCLTEEEAKKEDVLRKERATAMKERLSSTD